MTERKKPNNKRLILMIVLLAVVIALMWLLPDGSQPAAPATNAPKTEQTKNTNDAPDDIEATTLVKAGTQAPDFRVEMFDGTTFTLGSLRGKVVLLNFWATWCGPCQREMPDIQKLYEKYGKNTGDVIVLGVANPKTKDAPNNQDQAEPGIVQYLSENGYSYPVLMDRTGALFSAYGITSFPTTFMIDQEGNVFGYVTGMLTADIMESIVRQTLEGRRP